MNVPVAPMIGIGENFFCRLDQIKNIFFPANSNRVVIKFFGDEQDVNLSFGEGMRDIIRNNLKGSMPNLADNQYLAKLEEEIERMKKAIAQQRTAPTIPQGFTPDNVETPIIPPIGGTGTVQKPKTDLPDTE